MIIFPVLENIQVLVWAKKSQNHSSDQIKKSFENLSFQVELAITSAQKSLNISALS